MSRGEVSSNGENTPEFRLRDTTPADIGKMALIQGRARARRDGLPFPEAPDPGIIDEINFFMARPNALAYVALARTVDSEGEETMAGFIICHSPSREDVTRENDPSAGWCVAQLMVDPDHWRKGMASRLLNKAADTARDRDKEYIVLWTVEDNTPARQLYEKNSYRLTELTRLSERQDPMVHYLLEI